MPLAEKRGSLLPRARKALSPPNLVKTTGVAFIARHQVFAPDAEPTRNPDIDRLGFGQRVRQALGRDDTFGVLNFKHVTPHGKITLDLDSLFVPLIIRNQAIS